MDADLGKVLCVWTVLGVLNSRVKSSINVPYFVCEPKLVHNVCLIVISSHLSVDRTLVVHERNHEETSRKYDEPNDGRSGCGAGTSAERAGDMSSEVLLDLSGLSRLLGTSISFSFQMVGVPTVTFALGTELTSASV